MLNQYFKKTLSSVFFIVCFTTYNVYAELPPSCPHLSATELSKLKSAYVDWLPDGDTIHTKDKQKLRLLHINTPEINHKGNKPAEPYALKAKSELERLVGSARKIYWSTDVRVKDKYSRELAWIYNDKGVSINAMLVTLGYAHTLIIPPNQQHWSCIADAEKVARKSLRGIWSLDLSQPKATAALKPNQGFQLIQGQISEIKDTAKTRWLILDNQFWVGIDHKDFHFFAPSQLKFAKGEILTLRGYVYQSRNQLRLKLQHPAMLLESVVR